MFNIGEALIGDGNELAHVDLTIGEKEGPVGTAFAEWFNQPISWSYTTYYSNKTKFNDKTCNLNNTKSNCR